MLTRMCVFSHCTCKCLILTASGTVCKGQASSCGPWSGPEDNGSPTSYPPDLCSIGNAAALLFSGPGLLSPLVHCDKNTNALRFTSDSCKTRVYFYRTAFVRNHNFVADPSIYSRCKFVESSSNRLWHTEAKGTVSTLIVFRLDSNAIWISMKAYLYIVWYVHTYKFLKMFVTLPLDNDF